MIYPVDRNKDQLIDRQTGEITRAINSNEEILLAHVGVTNGNPHGTDHDQLGDILGTGQYHVTQNENAEIAALDGISTGIISKTGNAAYSGRTITGTTGRITVTNGDGVSGNPTITIPDTVTCPIKFGDVSNYSEFEADGTLLFKGTATTWDDLRIEPVSRAAGSNTPSFEQYFTNGAGSRGVYLYSFDDAAALSEKELHFTMQMPHSWAGTNIYLHIHWIGNLADTNATPYWGLEYTWAEIGATFGNSTIVYATGNGPGTPDVNLTQYKHYISSFSAITPSSTQDGISSVLIGRLFRHSSNASDTYDVTGNKCGLLYIDAHFETDTIGSRTEFSK